mgnify:FL=1
MITLTREECEALYDLIDQLSGGNPENVFAWDGTDDLSRPCISAAVKLFTAAAEDVPENLVGK